MIFIIVGCQQKLLEVKIKSKLQNNREIVVEIRNNYTLYSQRL